MMSGATPSTTTTAQAALPISPALSAITSTSSYDMMSASTISAISHANPFAESDPDEYSGSEEEIVWSVSEGDSESQVESSPEEDSGAASDDDYVVLSRPRSPINRNPRTTSVPPVTVSAALSTPIRDNGFGLRTPVTASNAILPLEAHMGRLSLDTSSSSSPPTPSGKANTRKNMRRQKQLDKEQAELSPPTTSTGAKQKKKKTRAAAKKKKTVARKQDAGAVTVYPPVSSSAKPSHYTGGEAWFEEMSIVKFTGLGLRPIVDDYSDHLSVVSYDYEASSVGGDSAVPTLYEEASTFISSFLSNPEAKNDTVCRLTLLQSLIIELGLTPSSSQSTQSSSLSLPTSLKSAKAFLKSRAFLNIREYIAVREQGPEAVKKVLHPSRGALIKDLRSKRNKKSSRIPLNWVKQHGLQVLLVGWNHH